MKSSKQINFLHALTSDKKKGMDPLSSPMISKMPMNGIKPPMNPNPMVKPMSNPVPVGLMHMPQPAAPRLIPPPNQMNPIAAPSLPGMDKMPKFGKMKNSLKGQFKK